MKEKQKCLAIIDDGVYGIDFPEGARITHLRVSGNQVEEDREPGREITHGALCAAIILRECLRIPIISIKIMEQDTAGDIRRLGAALSWCLAHKVPLIHMSLGVAVYGQQYKLQDVIQRLVDGGALIVASFHNRNIPTWPACFPGVFGVRADCRGILPDRGIAFDSSFPGNQENGIIARIDESLGEGIEEIRYANSFAAPVVTARLAGMVLEETDLSFRKARKRLEENAAVYPVKAFAGMYCAFAGRGTRETEKPVLWAGRDVLQQLVGEFEQNGYDISVFSDFGEGVPLEIYGQREYLREGFIGTMAEIYPADALLISTKQWPVLSFDEIDMYVMKVPQGLQMVTETATGICQSMKEAFGYIRGYFS